MVRPSPEELGNGRCDAWGWNDVEDETVTGVETVADVDCAESMARSLDASVIFDNPPEKGMNNLCVSARRESPAGGGV
jgi:hypothetical protein